MALVLCLAVMACGCSAGGEMDPPADTETNSIEENAAENTDTADSAPGVYAVNVCVGQSAEVWHGMMNIGSRPTFGGDHLTLETHIFHFDGNLYGQSLTIRFIERLRAERKFDSREALVAQLAADARQAELLLNC